MVFSGLPRTYTRTAAALLASVLAVCAGTASAGQRIVNGLETQAYPTTGALLHHALAAITSVNAAAYCTGTLIGCHTFLTAAHCAGDPYANHYWVYLQHGGIYEVTSVVMNPDYDPNKSGNDIAIVTLARDVVGIAPTPINSTHDLAALGVGYAGVIAGFGQTSGSGGDYGIKRYGAVTTADCNPAETGGDGNDHLVCWDFTNPIGLPGSDSNTCNGDSGGPLFIDFGSGPEVVGATSAGISGSCLPTDHSWDASVYFNSAFIQSQLAGDSTSACGSALPVGDASATVLADSGTLNGINTEDTYTISITGLPALARFTMNGKDNKTFHTAFYVKQGIGPAGPANYDCKSDGGAVYGGCEFTNPVGGPWSVTVSRYTGAGNYQMTTTLLASPAPVCGNGVTESAEQCDRADLGSCVSGPCNADCTCPAPVCGNNIVESSEQCDGSADAACPGTCGPACLCAAACSNGDLKSIAIKSTPSKLVYRAALLDPTSAYADLDPRSGFALEIGDGIHTVNVAIPAADHGWYRSSATRGRFFWRGNGSIDGLFQARFQRRRELSGDSWSVLFKGRTVTGAGSLDTSATLDTTLTVGDTCHSELW